MGDIKVTNDGQNQRGSQAGKIEGKDRRGPEATFIVVGNIESSNPWDLYVTEGTATRCFGAVEIFGTFIGGGGGWVL